MNRVGRTFSLVLIIALAFVLTACRTGQGTATPTPSTQAYADPVMANTALGLDLFPRVRTSEPNLVYSPLSISTALAMTYAGARGESAAEIARTMRIVGDADTIHLGFGGITRGLPEQSNEALTLHLANSLWIQSGLSYGIDFLQILEREYRSEMRGVDFQSEPEPSRALINDWVSERTNELINELIPQGVIDTETRLVLVNALYFKAKWAKAFSVHATRPGPFHVTKDHTVEVPMMRQESGLRYVQAREHDVVELPYANSNFSMVLLLPKQGTTGDFMGKTTAEGLAQIVDELKPGVVNLTMPKFSVRSAIGLKDALQGLGMASAFDPNRADFAPITRDVPLYVSHVVHEATVTVDELGTEAAAATGIVMVPTSGNLQKPVEITFDRPFVFFIRDRTTGLVLFMGEVQDPS